jgi:ATP-binding cassette subfamily B protein
MDARDCGPTCIRMIAKHFGKNYSLDTLRSLSGITKEGISLLGMSEAAESIGFRTMAMETSLDVLQREELFPFIAYWPKGHFVVVYKMSGKRIWVADPARDLLVYTTAEFMQHWVRKEGQPDKGIVLLLEPSPQFYKSADEKNNKLSFAVLFGYWWTYRRLLFQLLAGLLLGSLIQLVLPFLTQAIVDVGIDTRDISFIYIILLAQSMLFIGQISVDFIRSWILLHINTRVNVSILSDFLIKLMRLPISFFDSRMIGDIIQRMDDQQRIQNFLTGPALQSLFSFFNLVVLSVVIMIYSPMIFLLFFAGSLVYVCWVLLFLRRRRILDYKRFDTLSRNQSTLISVINGIQEIKMNNCEMETRWKWERLQAQLFRINVRTLGVSQRQQGGGVFITQCKNMLVTVVSATAVINGRMTLGQMLAIQYIIGALQGPIEQFIQFSQSLQDAQLSMRRLNEIHGLPDEEPDEGKKIRLIPQDGGLQLEKVGFKYPGAGNDLVLKDVDVLIPMGKMTAIVGASGSGKTTLLKLLMKFYPPSHGRICLGEVNLDDLSNRTWRSQCGVVLQDSYIFPDTIARNIAINDEEPDRQKLAYAVRVANIDSFVESLPLGFDTRLGGDGQGISQGQRQRILIARAVYKDPAFIFFDEATNSLDANNETIIQCNLETFFKGRTVVVAAHRLSTVKNADRIIVMEKGSIAETGTHRELVDRQGVYFTLIKSQLEWQD